MRSVCRLFLCILFIFVPAWISSSNILGDVNGDGEITLQDGVDALKCSAGIAVTGDCTKADVDVDGVVTQQDGVAILRYVARIRNTFRTSLLEPLPCGYYTDGLSQTDLFALDTHVTFIMDYVTDAATLCRQIRDLGLAIKPMVPIYHKKGDSRDDIWGRTAEVAVGLQPCIDEGLIGGLNLGDHPDHYGLEPWQVQEAVNAANEFMPTLPTFIYFLKDDYPRPYNLTYQGIAFYNLNKYSSTEDIFERLWRVHERHGNRVIVILRAWDDHGKCCSRAHGNYTDEEMAFYVEMMYWLTSQLPWVHANMYYVFTASGDSLGARELPVTRATIERVCKPSQE